ncbi:MAG: hypothetical protein HDS15_04825 [Bacteroides sp.]|nr:hypothetical protein [Bacteroides sp.]
MTRTPEKLLSLSFEIEGLLMLIERRDDRTPADIYDLLLAKADELANGVKVLASEKLKQTTGETETAQIPAVAQAPEINEQPIAEAVTEAEEARVENEQAQIAESVEYEDEADANIAEATVAPPKIMEMADEKPEAVHEPEKQAEELTLTINDKFRFSRALFAGSIEELKECVQTVSTLGNMDEVKDYLINDMCMNPDDEDVAAFIELIENHRK